MFWNKKKKESNKEVITDNVFYTPPPTPRKEIRTINDMLQTIDLWLDDGREDIAAQHWQMLSDEAKKYSDELKEEKK